jgi:hypothetical protein
MSGVLPSHCVAHALQATAVPLVPLSASAGVSWKPYGPTPGGGTVRVVPHAPALRVRTRIPSVPGQAAATRSLPAATDAQPSAVVAMVAVGDHVAPPSVVARAWTLYAPSALQATIPCVPRRAMLGSPDLPSGVDLVVDPMVVVVQVTPRSLVVASRIEPVTESVNTTYAVWPFAAMTGTSTRPLVEVRRTVDAQAVDDPKFVFTRTYRTRGAVGLYLTHFVCDTQAT